MHELYKLEGPLKEKGDEQLIEDWFFFSSRERHTRWNCDWSSDVCSSDLIAGHRLPVRDVMGHARLRPDPGAVPDPQVADHSRLAGQDHALPDLGGPADPDLRHDQAEIGRASCRERGWGKSGER